MLFGFVVIFELLDFYAFSLTVLFGMGVKGSNPAVSGVITKKVLLAAGFIQSTLWLIPVVGFDC